MSYTPGLYYVNGTYTGACKATASEACTAATNTWSNTYGCYNGSTYRHPTPCLIGSADSCPITQSGKPYYLNGSNLSGTCAVLPDGTYHCTTMTEAFLSAFSEGRLNNLFIGVLLIIALVASYKIIKGIFVK